MVNAYRYVVFRQNGGPSYLSDSGNLVDMNEKGRETLLMEIVLAQSVRVGDPIRTVEMYGPLPGTARIRYSPKSK